MEEKDNKSKAREKLIKIEKTLKSSKIDDDSLDFLVVELEKLNQFTVDVARINTVEPSIAKNLRKAFHSKRAAVFAEASLMAGIVQKKTNIILLMSKQSTDAFYRQDKLGGLYVRLEIKSVTTKDASSVNRQIKSAEDQHKQRLIDEKKPTWHKTAVIIDNKDNPWPCSTLSELKKLGSEPKELLKVATERVQKLQLGSHTHSKKYAKKHPKEVSEKLALAQKLQEEKEKELVKTPKRKGKPSCDSDTPIQKTRYGRTIKSTYGKRSETPNTKGRRLTKRKITQKTERLSPRSKVKAKLLVTECITVLCPHQDRIYVLNRGEDVLFKAHFKGDEKEEGVAKRSRTHWGAENIGKRLWRKSANKEGNNPLHQAVIEKKMDFIKYFSQFSNMDKPNENGDHPIHLACKCGDLKILELLCDKLPDSLEATDADGNTVLHLACGADNIEAAELFVRKGADLDSENNIGATPRSLITIRDNKQWDDLISKVHKRTLK